MTKATLPASERDVLACLNKLEEATAMQLCEAMHSYRPMTHGSMMTLLKRLEAKELVERRKGPVGKSYVFSVKKGRQAPFKNMLKELVQRVFHNDGAALVASLFETKPPTPEQLERIRKMVDQLEQKHSRKGDLRHDPDN